MNASNHDDSFERSGVLSAGVIVLAILLGSRGAGAVETASVGPAGQHPQTPSSLAQAIRIAERETGERARKVEMERERGVEVYEIDTVLRDRSSTVPVDLASSIGTIFDSEDQREDQALFDRLAAISMTLADAVEVAEKETGGRAVEASVGSQYGSTQFQVRVVKDFVTQRVVVDPSTGKVVTVPRRGDGDRR